jgi:hypothetical protein
MGLGEVEPIDLVDLQRAKQQPGIDNDDRTEGQDRSQQLGDPSTIDFVEGFGTDYRGDDLCSRTDDVRLRLDRVLARVSDGGHLVTVNAGHEIYLDKPTALIDAISDLLEAGG